MKRNKKISLILLFFICTIPVIFCCKNKNISNYKNTMNKDWTIREIQKEMYVQRAEIPRETFDRSKKNWKRKYKIIPKNILLNKEEIKNLIKIKNTEQADELRKQIIKYVWQDSSIPNNILPILITKNLKDDLFIDTENLKRIDSLKLTMKNDISSIFYHFLPDKSNNHLVIYHQGHAGNAKVLGNKTIKTFINKGYHVLAFSMPLIGEDNIVSIEDIRKNSPTFYKNNIKYFDKLINTNQTHLKHKDLEIFETQNFNYFRFFLDPVLSGINHMKKYYSYNDKITIIGLSGGGWTTTVYAALDPRITLSYPVAGSLPLYLRGLKETGSGGSIGDIEQQRTEFYKIANYLDLYILGSIGKNRRQLQILNQYDSCCFAGLTGLNYKDIIKQTILKNEGSYDLTIDTTHIHHQISDFALQLILKDIENY